MNEYLAFPVKIEATKPAMSKDVGTRSRVIEHQNAESALADASNRIPLNIGEHIAIVLIKKNHGS